MPGAKPGIHHACQLAQGIIWRLSTGGAGSTEKMPAKTGVNDASSANPANARRWQKFR